MINYVDPTDLIDGGDVGTTFNTPITLDLATKTISIQPGSGFLSNVSDGVTGQALYSALKILWKNNNTYIKFPFPMEAITPEQYEIINGWSFADLTTRKAIRTAGWVERDLSGNIISVYAGIISLGTIRPTDLPYYSYDPTGLGDVFTFTGPINEPVQIYYDPSGTGSLVGGFDRRDYLTLIVREEQRTFALSTLDDIGVTQMGSQVYRFPLTTAVDARAVVSDSVITTDPDIGEIKLYFDESATNTHVVGSETLPAWLVVEGNYQSLEVIHSKIQYLLRQTGDVFYSFADGITLLPASPGRFTAPIARFVGDTLYVTPTVHIRNILPADVNRIVYTNDYGDEFRYPFVAGGTLTFNQTLVQDPSSVYRLYFSDGFGTVNAMVVNDNDGNPIQGSINTNTIPFTFDYDGNNQGSRVPGTDVAVTLVAIGLASAQYVSVQGSLTRQTSLNISAAAPVERNYRNP